MPRGKTKLNEAIALLVANPIWTNEQIARTVGCHPKYLSSKEANLFKQTRKALRAARRDALPRGRKSRDGEMEAWVGED
jgi:hypothetical protein